MYPHERSLVKRLEGKPFALVGVNSDDTRNTVKAAMKSENITWPSFFDGGSTQGPIATSWKIEGWPTLYVIDHKGVIRQKYVGSPPPAVLDKVIEDLVAIAEKEQGDEESTTKGGGTTKKGR